MLHAVPFCNIGGARKIARKFVLPIVFIFLFLSFFPSSLISLSSCESRGKIRFFRDHSFVLLVGTMNELRRGGKIWEKIGRDKSYVIRGNDFPSLVSRAGKGRYFHPRSCSTAVHSLFASIVRRFVALSNACHENGGCTQPIRHFQPAFPRYRTRKTAALQTIATGNKFN